MTIRDAYLLSGSQWGDILFEGEFLFLHVKLSHWSATVMTPLGKIQRAYIALYHILLYIR